LALVAFAFTGMDAADIPAPLRDRFRLWGEHVLWLMDAAGQVPEIGDNDAGRVIMFGQAQEPRYVASVLAALAGWLKETSLAPPARDPHLRDFVFGSITGSGVESGGFRQWKEGGYSVFRGADARHSLVFDHGPVGHSSIAAHGHADTLAVWLTVG